MAMWEPVNRPWEAEGRRLWEGGDLSAAEIGARLGVSKSVLIGVAHRRGWKPRRPAVPERTMSDRLGLLHARMDAVMERYGAVR